MASGAGSMSFRSSPIPYLILLIVAVLAWWATIREAQQMAGMPGTMGMPVGAFLVMWAVMMIGMMLPSAAPAAVVWSKAIVGEGGFKSLTRVLAFLLGYFVVWSALGIGAYGILLGIEWVLRASQPAAVALTSVTFIGAGIYQLTRVKSRWLDRCRASISSPDPRGEATLIEDVRTGLRHGIHCVGCCLGLMVVLTVVGAMNLVAMALLALVILLEKVLPWGHTVGKAAGVALILLGAAAPVLLALVQGGGPGPAPMEMDHEGMEGMEGMD